ncbi:hypothetical protein O0L34_g8512 [Tuta absoluta]|nr:hypothetical protein O0L34_g8512 [Tuta absoluta]
MIPSNQWEEQDTLYLHKDGADSVAITLPIPLPQHQLDGIRFLFRQFHKKAPGVILNDPSGYGKQLQVALYLNAIRPTLKRPVLVISNSVEDWKEQFDKWTSCSSDLAVESPNPYTAKQICINPVKDGVSFSRRAWGVVVAHDEHATKELLKIRFNADYKIWVTANDLKDDLYTLASIYEWLHPNQKFNVNLFSAKKDNKRDEVEKALLLDAFLEDFLIRRTDFISPFYKPKKITQIEPSPVKVTRKNKDPTGTKVKRSKKRIINDDDDNHVNESLIATATIVPRDNLANDDNKYNVNESSIVKDTRVVKNHNDDNKVDMDVESFIRNEEPIQSEGFNFINSNETSQDSVTVPNNESESMEIDFTSAVQEIVEHEKSLEISTHEASQNDRIDFENHVNDIENNISQIEDKTKNSHEANKKKVTSETVDVGDEISNRIIVPATEESQNISNITFNRNITIPETESENTRDMFKNFIHNFDEKKSEEPQSNDWKIQEDLVSKQNKVSQDSKSITGDQDKGETSNANDNTNSKTNVGKKKTKIEEFDAEMAEIEAKALKKFKGSILDSLF